MAEFVIRLSDEHGYIKEQVESGRSVAEVRERLLRQGLLVVGVKQRGLSLGAEISAPRKTKIRLAEFVAFNQQFVTLIKAGIPVLTALDLLTQQQPNPRFRDVLRGVYERVKSGELLSDAFAHQEVFPKIYITTLLAGEKSGNLEEVIGRYVHFQRLALSFRKKLLASLIYPSLLISMVVIMTIFLVTFVVPRFADLYSQLGSELPPITALMLELGINAQRYLTMIAIAGALSAFGLWRWARTESGSLRLDRWILALPLLGVIWLKYQVSVFTRMMSTLLSGGLPVVPALQTASASIQSRDLSIALADAAQRVSEGQPLARSLQQTSRFPNLSLQMIEVGESTGALSAMLTSVAEFYEEDVETALAATLSLIEPAILIVMAVVVGFVLISLYLPIFKLGAGGGIH